MRWQCGRFDLNLDSPKVMGIVNVTPDSFSDGGVYSQNLASVLAHAQQLLDEGADILDVGGESTRPGSDYVSPEEEWQRVAPVIEALYQWQVPLTLDTRRTYVMQQALQHGWVDAINDVAALSDEGAVETLAQYPNIGVCLMHMQGIPESMQHNPQYSDVTAEVVQYLQSRVAACLQAGIKPECLLLDPGFGFGKTLQHNVDLMRDLKPWIEDSDYPVLIGVSRKTMLGQITGIDVPEQRMVASVMAAVASIARGAHIVRVHDVKETVQAVKVWQELGVWA
ncbi:dihydropteroate synthase [Vitreoscilla massiliensis]|uniref:Dihydropteroate synthase n=1 Tax=Vitreoscilla massiliensis TaxID=1689272 RepID=A0ABY4E4P0_9NEIS|nr:dihydropteroate synthase [Vitreoscilla massiliensis]UOO90298.1 dihydropteroate synthase [Vitreoscilla massiliensis]